MTATIMPRRGRAGATAIALTVAALTVTACATQDEVRRACEDHGGVNAVSGSSIAKYVTCRDGHYRTIR